MPPLAHSHEKHASRDLKSKKTKSRNGCGRCKIKRLKCDETTPGCLQCKKRNVPCPGYEKTLKWSTKYEVFQPAQLPKAVSKTPVKEATLTPEVERHFEALAAVLPAGKKTPENVQSVQRNASRQATPPATAVEPLASSEDSSPEPSGLSPPEFETLPDPFFFDDNTPLDPLLLDGIAIGMPNEDFVFDHMDGFDVDPGPFDCVNFNGSTEVQEDTNSTSSSPRLSRSLLLDFYRLPSPTPSMTSVDDVESILIQHYFKDVCSLFSSFDSVLNPFRTTISRIYRDTPSIYYAIQSMSAAHLANTFPNMASVGLEMQRKACDALHEELPLVQSGQVSCTKTFLSIMLLGLTTSWHEVNNLGEEFLSTARSLILPRLLSNSNSGEEKKRETQFFEESLIYWEMIMGFVNKDSITFAPNRLRSRGTGTGMSNQVLAARKPDGKIVPHPWTGIAPTIQILFAEVGRLVRRERALDAKSVIDIRCENLLNAATLEEDLLAADYPLADELAELGDERTSKQDFIVMAEAYRCAGLLEIYCVFPSILRKRLGTSWTANVDFEFPTPRFETRYEDTDTKLWLNSLAMHILDMIESIPSSSGTICIQQILLVTAASELRFVSSVDYFDVYANDVKVLQARKFAIKRLQEHALRLPAKPLRKQIELIKEVWRRQDNGDDAFWIDVMDENGWQTIMG
ncbi:hypothetical protein P280DRAFT_488549 [Massarina eburnea CBS 473.64]|uniref:Zn(2)-C6 fungal-type domain-containing protein n=1 Tax=Massarina eburnea CBS 473.64 TaxID=1395130 RepID=A0A6A6S7G5_9PLEO|nr:hypothetical protein P280DRAFT_488549 [Massarina eburnea CBS 473.64]